ncbi:hypothetical protein RMR21_009565 [Agrobacterium sp. rho-8.1]|nr:hypothetical protein [Agrobacterium sp. rho-8.1]
MIDEDNLNVGDWIPEGTSRVLIDDERRRVVIHRIGNGWFQTIEPKTLEEQFAINAQEANEFSRTQKLGENQKVSSMPPEIYYWLKEQGIADNPERLKRWLNDSDNSKFRTNSLRV